MVISLLSQRVGTTAVLTGLLLSSGCRSASVNSNSGSSGLSSPISAPPFYRSFQQTYPSYDGNNGNHQTPLPQPEPPSVLPVPGYSEPELPPSPSAKKSRWNLVPSGFKFPSSARQNSDVRQSGTQSKREYPTKLSTIKSRPDEANDSRDDVVEETVSSRFDTKPDVILHSSLQPIKSVAIRPSNRMPTREIAVPVNETPFDVSTEGSIKTRYGEISRRPGLNAGLRPRLTPLSINAPNESNEPKPITIPSSEPGGEMPLLLPPGY